MDEQVFQSIRRIVHEKSGIDLKQGKSAMVAARIGRRLRQLQLSSAEQYLQHLKQDADEMVELLNVISTNVTRFYRELPHFEFLDRLLTHWFKNGRDRLRIWSAASSTGEEPYSIAMAVTEAMRRTKKCCDFRLLATDISTRVLGQAKAATYLPGQLENVPGELRSRYFTRVDDQGETRWRVVPGIRDQVVFHRLNLNEPPFPMRGPMDIVFCCNVMIYFDAQTKRRLLSEVHRLLAPDGYLIVSHTESLTGLTDLFKPVQPSIYAPVSQTAAGALRSSRGAA